MPIQTDFSDLQAFQLYLRALDSRLSDLRPFWRDDAVPLVQGEIAEVFLTEGRGEWDGLHPAYAAQKEQTHPGKTILRRDDHYITAATSTSHPANVFISEPTEMTYGIDGGWFDRRFGDNYPERHELGVGVPQREVFGKLTETGELDANIASRLDRWSDNEIAEIERRFF